MLRAVAEKAARSTEDDDRKKQRSIVSDRACVIHLSLEVRDGDAKLLVGPACIYFFNASLELNPPGNS